MKLLIIEDSTRLRRSLVTGFTRLGYAVDDSADGRQGLGYARSNHYDVIILDLMLPGMDGLSVLQELRSQHDETHVLILSAKDDVNDRIQGLNSGADDYMIKPFSFDELHARLLTLTRRKHNVKSPLIGIGELVINTVMRQVSVNSKKLSLTPTEYIILEHLSLNADRVITYSSLIDQICNCQDTISRNTLEAHISSLRKKLKIVNLLDFIKTKRGFGYYVDNN
ncbi:Two-component transcriptional response regulator, LuxR family [hydrothermal vent metagenome]|uniref:Two-component transcriptional response regulator, LuxR family n=1 Tax=hydrothermal vent metagenome TaxID=652676 RepID=A0A3B0XQJ1_9ZZZZ